MPNKNYLKGRRREWKIKKQYEKDGWICIRSAGSKSPFDLVCIEPAKEIVHFIQCKPKSMSNHKKKMLEDAWNVRISGEDYRVEFVVI
jgi:Holliday junction resolvase